MNLDADIADVLISAIWGGTTLYAIHLGGKIVRSLRGHYEGSDARAQRIKDTQDVFGGSEGLQAYLQQRSDLARDLAERGRGTLAINRTVNNTLGRLPYKRLV